MHEVLIKEVEKKLNDKLVETGIDDDTARIIREIPQTIANCLYISNVDCKIYGSIQDRIYSLQLELKEVIRIDNLISKMKCNFKFSDEVLNYLEVILNNRFEYRDKIWNELIEILKIIYFIINYILKKLENVNKHLDLKKEEALKRRLPKLESIIRLDAPKQMDVVERAINELKDLKPRA